MDFPREGNGNSFTHARRQFNLVDDKLLRYKYLWEFDVAMNWLEDTYKWLSSPQVRPFPSAHAFAYLGQAHVSLKHEGDKVIVFERAGLLFIFNCTLSSYDVATIVQASDAKFVVHPTESFTDYRVGVDVPGEYKVVLSSDEKKFGGHDRIALDGRYFTTPMEWNGRSNWLQVRQADL